MVKTEGKSTVEDGWREVFERSRLLPPPRQTVRLAAESHFTQSQGFQLILSRLTGAHLPQEMSEGEQDVAYQLRVTLFDRNHQQFFGKTWKSLPQKMKNNKISFNEVLYFHTSLRLPSMVVVLELVSLSPRPDGSQQALGRGFTVLELFTNRPEAQAADGDRRLNLHHGSPRSLLHPLLKDTVDYSSLLKTVDGAHLECVIKNHPALVSMMHLLPENVLVSGDENIPGLAASPTGDALLRPQLLKMLPFSLNRLTINLQPSLEKFESQLLQLINADCHNTKQPGPEGTLRTVVIQERRLHVGVHNGWCFLDNPQVVVLEPLASGTRGRADSISKQSTLVKDSAATSSLPQTLGLRSSLELRLTNHRAVAIVFQLEWVFSAPIGRETMLSTTSTSRAAFLQCLRWGIWCPFQEPADWKWKEVQLVLQGGAKPNPHGVMVYSTEMSAKTQNPAPLSAQGTAQVSEAKDIISFRLSSSLERKASSPKASLRTKQEDVSSRRRSPSSPSQGQKYIPPASPPESPQGPGLSLSQLAVTSRYPTISHSSSALPWQQPFPSLLHPSPLASAHQLSHVAYTGVSNIAHLEVDLQRGGDASPSAQEEGDQLQELPFTPVHAPVITLGMNVPTSCSVSSRSSLAHLYSAGFPDIVDCNGQVAEVLDPTEPVPFDPQREETDLLQSNLLVFQFLAFTRIPTAGVGPDWPDNIYFTFQFYRFPPVTSQQLKLLTSDKVQQKASDPLPCVLASINKDGTVNSGSPGLQVQFRVDKGFLRPGEKRWFLRYLALHTMHIDIWDSDSLLLIGSTAIELKYMLRQGKSAVQALHEVEVLTTDYVGEDTLLTSTDSGRRSAFSPVTVHTIIRGRLYIRTGNIGCPVDPSRRRAADVMPPHSHIITPREVTGGFRGGSLSSRNILQLNARNTAQAHKREIDGDHMPPFRRGVRAGTIMPGEHNLNEVDGGRRKLSCMAAVHQREGKEDAKAAKVTDRTKADQLTRELHQIKPSEERSKAEGIANMLSQAITTQHLLYPSLGTAEYMEFVLKNPFNVPQTVTIHSDDPELSVITNTDEWRYFKALTKTTTPLEENMFHLEEGAPRVYLRPKESIHIPLKYQSFLCDHTMALQGPSFLPTGKGSQVAKKNLSNIVAAKTIKVTFKAEDGKPMAICQVNVEATPHIVDQTFRLYHPELCFLKKAIRLPPWHDPTVNLNAKTHVSIRCSDPNIICQTRMLVPGEPQDVYLKVPGSPSPHLKMFFVMVFTDKWMAVPSQIWQIYVHFLERVDVSCVTGQRSCQSLVLKGKQAVRKVKCFSSHPQEIEVDPEGVFVLPPSAVQELQLKVQPWRAGSRFLYVNAVDVEHRRLVTAWLLCLNVHRPVLSKAFEVSVPVGGERGSSRKITYTNPYTSSRIFLLRSDHPDLLQFKEDKFQVRKRHK
ncbi:nephrocystin-4 isoform X2 [Micropterus salmoides]|uniref:nephrocystin-4 isoform X2 n=1 Tax=Micropterus salmoides TaxID=27706 RepID=UPI0018ED34C4|nr:nephrocystin-4 isoform X2 [Micropterus salmoides]